MIDKERIKQLEETGENRQVWVVYNTLYERVFSAHKSEEGAIERCYQLNKNFVAANSHWYEYFEFTLEE